MSGAPSPRSGSGRAADALALVSLGLLAGLCWHWNVLRSGERVGSIVNHDLFAEFFPRHHYFGNALRAGELPLWDPHQIAGLPFLATLQGGALYPPNWLYALLPTGAAMGAIALLHLVLAGVFAYALARALARSRSAAWLAGLVFMLGGSTLFLVYHTNAINSAPWLPASLLCTARLAREPGPRWTVALAASFALQFLAGRDYTFLMSFHAVALFALFEVGWQWRDRGPAAAGRTVAWLVAAALLAGGLAAAQALPTLALASQSARSLAGLEGSYLEIFGPQPPSFFLANLVNPVRGPLRREYFGWLPLVLALLAFRPFGRERATSFASVLAVVSLLLCFGSQTPLYALYRELPLGAAFRLPDRFVFLLSLSLALLSAGGLDALFGVRGSARERLRALAPGLVVLVVFGAGLTAAVLGGWITAGLAAVMQPWGWFWLYDVPAAHYAHLGRALAYLAGAVGFVAAAIAAAGTSWARPLRVGMLALAAADLAWSLANPFLHPARNPTAALSGEECYRRAGAITGEYGRHLSLGIPGSHALKDKDGELFGRYSATHYDPLVTRRQAAYFDALQAGGPWIAASPVNERSLFMGFLTKIPTPERRRLLDLLSVRALLVDARRARTAPLARLLAGFEPVGYCRAPVALGPSVALYANPQALPRAFVVHRVSAARDPAEALARIVAPGFDPRGEAVIEGVAPALPDVDPNAASAASSAEIVRYESARVSVRVETAQPGLLVLTDAWDPDWRATVDGRAAAILPSDALFRGVAVPAGRSEVEFGYAPASVPIGAALSLVSAALCGGLLWRARRPARVGRIEGDA